MSEKTEFHSVPAFSISQYALQSLQDAFLSFQETLNQSFQASCSSALEHIADINRLQNETILNTLGQVTSVFEGRIPTVAEQANETLHTIGGLIREILTSSPELTRKIEYVREHQHLLPNMDELPIDEALEIIYDYYQKPSHLPPIDEQLMVCGYLVSMSSADMPDIVKDLIFGLLAFVTLRRRS